uniref:Transposase Tc1-like domain-containing protein n=1 Tax=Nothobranchius furzeri TaxID=105023 RepID=A0A8C6M762_NOTFU
MVRNADSEGLYRSGNGEGYKKISKALHISQNTAAKVIQTFKKDGSAAILQRHPGSPRKLASQERLLMRRVRVRDTIWRTLQRNGMHGYPRAHAERDEDYWDSRLWSDETKITVFGTNGFKTVWRCTGEDFKEKCMVPTVKHGGGRRWSVSMLLCFGHLCVIFYTKPKTHNTLNVIKGRSTPQKR